MKAIILARVSTEEQMTEGQSIPAQLARAQKYAKRKNLEVVNEYQFDESSIKDKRNKFENVIEEIKKSKEKIALIVECIDRLQRSFKESVLLDKFTKQGELEIHFVRENLVISKDSNSSEIMRWDMGVMFAKNFVLQIGDNVKRTFSQKVTNGQIIRNSPVGYLNIPDDKLGGKKAIPDPVRSPYIIKIFELYASNNHSMKTIADLMEKENLRSKNGRILKVSGIERILKNPFYYGFQKHKGKIYPHKYPPLISYDLFLKCQRIREARHKKPTKYASKPFAFRGLIRCAKCGCLITPEIHKGKFIYYHCTNSKGICEKVYVNENKLIEPVKNVFDGIKLSQSKIDEITESLRVSEQGKNKFYTTGVSQMRQKSDQMDDELKIAYEDRLKGRITPDKYDNLVIEKTAKQKELTSEIAKYIKANESFYLTANHVLSLAQRSAELFESSEPEEKRQLVNFLFQNLQLDGKKLLYTIKKPLDTVFECKTTNVWGG